ncbi:hypothetical protein [Sphaerisporangium fuscum]|uniref:hypothetical protein n=1 Tax=Sphaerisporangium fuscum TaxID=2835868 RepID=UPI001BDD251E|nr:hypothetical protein [Sphaerisporangium fuscum]
MSTSQHEALHRIFQEHTELIPRVLQKVLNVPLPDPIKIEVMNVDLTDLQPVPRWVDTLAKIHLPDRAVITAVESQTKASEQKRRRWARYLSYLHDQHQCDVLLIVTCRDAATARWAREPHQVGLPEWPTLTVRPLVLGPDNVPAITDVDQALEDIDFAVLSALVHAKSRNVDAILDVLSNALKEIDEEQASELMEFTEFGLGTGRAQQIWRMLMATKPHAYISETRAKGRAEGRAEGEAKTILLVLETRGLPVTDAQRERITSCTDTDQLEQWARRAVVVAATGELFG